MRTSGNYILPGDFGRFLVKLNPRLRVIRGDGDQRHRAGLYHWSPSFNPDKASMEFRSEGNWEYVCGVATNWIPERTIFETDGRHIWKRGWREVVALGARKHLIRIPDKLGHTPEGVLRCGIVRKFSENGELVTYGVTT